MSFFFGALFSGFFLGAFLAFLQLPDVQADPGGFAQFLLNAIMSKQWGLFGAVLVTGLVTVIKIWGPKLPLIGGALEKFLGFTWAPILLAVVGSVAGALGTALLAGGPISAGLVLQAILVGLGGVGVFEAQKAARAKGEAASGQLKTAEDVDAFLGKGPQ